MCFETRVSIEETEGSQEDRVDLIKVVVYLFDIK